MITYVVIIVGIAFVFDFINVFHDSANSIATIVGTRVLSHVAAVAWAALFNFFGAFVGTTAVAKAVSSGFVAQSVVDANVILGGLLGAIIWDLITWWFGIPTSSSHAIIGGFAGAGVSKGGISALLWGAKWKQTLSAIVVSPLLGAFVAFFLMVFVLNVFQNPTLENTGYGVGLDQAAAYLAQKPDSRNLTVLAANGYGSFSYYFPGHTTPINNFTLGDPQVVQVLADAQYVVVDYYNQNRINLISDLQGITPEHTIWIDGIDFLRIYAASDFGNRHGSSAP